MSSPVDRQHHGTHKSAIRRSRKRPILHGFTQMIAWFILLLIILALLASTSFLSDFILNRLNSIAVTVNPIAAASHQPVVEASPISSPAETTSAVTEKFSAKTAHHRQNHGKNRDPAAEAKPDLVKVLSAPATPLEQEKVRQLADEAPPTGIASKIIDPYADQKLPPPRDVFDGKTTHTAQAIVVLGGGLTRDHQGQIIPNAFTRMRLLQAISQHRATQLPIFLSGVEAPYMQDWLKAQGESAEWLEARSMNTCENARFSALLLQKLGGAPRVELVTDAWHIPRARWLFAMNGIETIAIPAALPSDPAPWWPSLRNLPHTRRALHELVAFSRDRLFGVVGCREVP